MEAVDIQEATPRNQTDCKAVKGATMCSDLLASGRDMGAKQLTYKFNCINICGEKSDVAPPPSCDAVGPGGGSNSPAAPSVWTVSCSRAVHPEGMAQGARQCREERMEHRNSCPSPDGED